MRRILTCDDHRMAELTENVRALLWRANFAHVATVLPSGAPHSVPVWIALEGDRIAFFTQAGSRKARNLAADPRVAISLVEPEKVHALELPFEHAPAAG